MNIDGKTAAQIIVAFLGLGFGVPILIGWAILRFGGKSREEKNAKLHTS